MNPDTLIFLIAGAQCRLDITQGTVVYVGSDVRADVCLQSPGVAPAHCAIEVLANDLFRVATLDGTPSLTINGEVTHDATVKAPFLLEIDNQQLDVRLESLEKKSGENFSAPTSTGGLPSPMVTATATAGPAPQRSEVSLFSRLFKNVSLSRNTKIALAATLTLGCFYTADKMWPSDDSQVPVMGGEMPDLSDFLRKFTLGSFSYTVNSAERVSLDDDDDFDRHFADSSGPWNGESEETPKGTSIYAVRMEVTNLDREKSQPFITEFALTNLNQQFFDSDAGATQTLTHQFNMVPMPVHIEPGASHECLVAFEVPNEVLLGMVILLASEKSLFKKVEARIGLNTQALADTIMKVAKVMNHLANQKTVSMDEMSTGEIATASGLIVPLGSGSSMMFRYCEGADFIMGSPTMEEGRHENESPTNTKLTRGYWMGDTECTQKQWSALMPQNPSHFQGKELPVDSVTWDQAKAFIDRLNAMPHLSEEWRKDWVFALPTEAQWEFACRAGNPASFNNGTFYTRRLRKVSPAESIAWFADNAEATTQLAGSKSPNPLGLHDMHGNVWEWCQDWYYPRLIGGIDPEGPANGTERVLRGGAFSSPESELRAARRSRLDPTAAYSSVGFRVAIVRKPSEDEPLPEVAQAPLTAPEQ